MFEQNEAKELREIGVTTLFDLALKIPKSFEDLTIKYEPNEGINTVLVEIKSFNYHHSMLSIQAFCYTWKCNIKIIIFHSKPWHYSTFKISKSMYINGKSILAYGSWQFINPKVITKVGMVIPKYKTQMKNEKLFEYIKKYVTKENLLKERLNEDEIESLFFAHKHSIILNENKDILYKLKFIEIYNYMKKLRMKKIEFPSQKFPIYDICDWISSLPFKLTLDQKNALNDIKKDFLSNKAVKRVVMGDVGSGKTIIIFGAALMAYPKIAILMVPTTILAQQIYDESKRLMPKFFKTLLVKKGAKNIEFTDVNLVIGTHTLIHQPLPKSPLIMIDEQHRFGSNQRQKIDELTRNGDFKAHFLQFSATPIPRTLSLIQSQMVNFSFLKQMPFKKNIHTIILQNSCFSKLLEHLKEQIRLGKQAIIVYPLVEESGAINYQSLSEASEFWLQKFNKVFITHGKDKQKEKILLEFRDNGNLLLTTTVVEVGISLERLSTIVIVGAERLGLATLHQLRGRIGRNGGEGWCYIYTKLKNTPKRLIEFSNTLDGFLVAKIDLKNRQAGDILSGSLQHGATFEFYDMEEDLANMANERISKFS